MKKTHGLKRAVVPVTRLELETWASGKLLARLERLRWCEQSPEYSDLSQGEIASASGMILFKSDPAWQEAHADLTYVLSLREHRPKKP